MKTRFTIVLILSFALFSSCEKYDEQVLAVVGAYEASILGVTGPFSLNISVDYGSHIFIDAPFDGYEWMLAEAKVRDKEDDRKRIEIKDQWIAPGVYIYGEGIYYEGSIQLDYTLEIEGLYFDYTIVGSKY